MKMIPHNFRATACLAAILCFSAIVSAQQSPPAPASRPALAAAPALPPVPRYPQQADVGALKVTVDANFWRMHLSFLDRIKQGPIGLLFLGDSITDFWRTAQNLPLFTKYYGKYDPANFGIGGDMTQHVLWRIENGELDGIKPKVIVLLIGTNNIVADDTPDIIRADTKIVTEIHQKLPDTKVLLLGVFPRSDYRVNTLKSATDTVKRINAGLAKLDDGTKTRFLDIGDKFLDADGFSIPKNLMADGLHPTNKGYQVWADAMQPLLDEMMK